MNRIIHALAVAIRASHLLDDRDGDELRAAAAAGVLDHDALCARVEAAEARVAKLERERDEAREQLRLANINALGTEAEANDLRDALATVLDTAHCTRSDGTRQRCSDESRAEWCPICRARALLTEHDAMRADLAREAELDRDEARAEIERLRARDLEGEP